MLLKFLSAREKSLKNIFLQWKGLSETEESKPKKGEAHMQT